MHPKVDFDMKNQTIHSSIQFDFEILIILSYIRKKSSTTKSVAPLRYSKPRAGFLKKDKNEDWLTQINNVNMEKNLSSSLGIKDVKE